MINEGDVALTPLPQADGQVKNRPVLVLKRMPPFGDLLFAASVRNYNARSLTSMRSLLPRILILRLAD